MVWWGWVATAELVSPSRLPVLLTCLANLPVCLPVCCLPARTHPCLFVCLPACFQVRRLITNPTVKHNCSQLLARAEGDKQQVCWEWWWWWWEWGGVLGVLGVLEGGLIWLSRCLTLDPANHPLAPSGPHLASPSPPILPLS